MSLASFALALLMYVIVPLWIAMGTIDWWCHKRSHIETTAGPKESLIHLLMFAEVGLPLSAALLLEVNALIIGWMIAMFLLHEITAYWDVSLAASERVVSPFEQRVHSYLELLPLLALALVLVLNHEQFLALIQRGDQAPAFDIVLKQEPLPLPYLLAVFTAAGVFNILPYLFELRRGLQARKVKAGGA